MRQKLEWVIKMMIYGTFFVPLIVIPSSFIFPFIVPKIVFFRSMIEIMLGAYALLLIIDWKKYKPDITPLTIAVFCFYIVSFGISTFVGVDAYHSFWDNHERMLGFFTISHYFAFYILCSKFINTWTAWKWAMRFFLFAGSIVMFIGLLQIGNPNLLLNQGSDRVASTLGNPIYVGGYALFLSFIAVLLIIKDKNRLWKYVYGFLMIFTILGIFFSGTRGSILALATAISVVFVVYIVALRGYKKTRIALVAILMLGVAVIGLLYANRQSQFVQKIPAIGRTVNTSLFSVVDSARWIAWEISWYSFLERPFFGWGPNNFFYAFNMHYDPRLLEHGYGETWFDNAHNIVMNTLAVQGGVGIITYVSLFAVGVIVLIGAYRRREIDVHILAIGSGFLIAHFVGNVTVFENITSYLYFMFWLAMINQVTRPKADLSPGPMGLVPKPEAETSKPQRNISNGAVVVTAIVAFLCVFIFNIQPARANMKTLDAIKALSGDPVLGYERMKIALEFSSPHIDDIRSDISRTATQLVSAYGNQLNRDLVKNIINLVYGEVQKNTILHPLDVRTFISLAQIAQMKAYAENNVLYLQEAINFMEKSLELSPRRQQVMYSLSMLYMQTGQYDKAISYLEETVVTNPNIGESYWRLAYIYKIMGDETKAREMIALGEKNGAPYWEQDLAMISQIFSTTTVVSTTSKK